MYTHFIKTDEFRIVKLQREFQGFASYIVERKHIERNGIWNAETEEWDIELKDVWKMAGTKRAYNIEDARMLKDIQIEMARMAKRPNTGEITREIVE